MVERWRYDACLEGVVQADGTVLGADGVRYQLKALERELIPVGLAVCFVPRCGKWGGTEWAIRVWPKDPDWRPDPKETLVTPSLSGS